MIGRLIPVLATSVRLGFATNSSSSHSIVVVPRGTEPPDNRPSADFGWEWFRLSSRAAKLDYLHAQIAGQIRHQLRGAWRKAPPGMPELPYDDVTVRDYSEAYATTTLGHQALPGFEVDHDSQFSHPLADGGLPDPAFARWFRDRVLDPGVMILGGNDNEQAPYGFRPDDAENFSASLPDDEYNKPAQVFDRGDHWLLFTRENGARIRVPKVQGATILTTPVPELVDLKVTQFCPLNCRYCYQGSDSTGAHSTVAPYVLADLVKKMGVREVALGGGEPAVWPGLIEFLNHLSEDRDPVVNITTRAPQLIPFWVLDRLGSVGISVDSASDARRHLDSIGLVSSAIDASDSVRSRAVGNPWREKVVLQVVLGAVPMGEVLDVMETAAQYGVSALLLGYKTTGRGAGGPRHDYSGWTGAVAKRFLPKPGWWQGPRLGVDAVLVSSHRDEIARDLGTNHRLMSDMEGAFSLYVDAVAMTAARHSYGAPPVALPDWSSRDYRWPETAAAAIVDQFRVWNS